jgi:hypothetical protein
MTPVAGAGRERPDEPDDSMAHPLAAVALEEGCSRVEAALWALIGEQVGVHRISAGDRFRRGIRRYVEDRCRGDASAVTLLGLLRQVGPPLRIGTWGR